MYTTFSVSHILLNLCSLNTVAISPAFCYMLTCRGVRFELLKQRYQTSYINRSQPHHHHTFSPKQKTTACSCRHFGKRPPCGSLLRDELTEMRWKATARRSSTAYEGSCRPRVETRLQSTTHMQRSMRRVTRVRGMCAADLWTVLTFFYLCLPFPCWPSLRRPTTTKTCVCVRCLSFPVDTQTKTNNIQDRLSLPI